MDGRSAGTGNSYWPGLDGVRAVAVLGVLAFHQGFGWAGGGFLGVSLFFTLSGYLITRRLVSAAVVGRPVRLRQFWARRARRLLPAAWLVAAVSVAASARFGIGGSLELSTPIAMLTQVLNWHFIAGGDGYGDLFAAPTVLDHYWSLAIEEQFYVVLPVGLWLLLGRGDSYGRPRLTLAFAMALGLAVVSAALLIGTGTGDIAYYGTHTRLSELAIGVAGGVAVTRWPSVLGAASSALGTVIGGAALVVLFASWRLAAVDSAWLYERAGLTVHAAVALLLLVVASSDSALARLLTWWPLRRLGRLSYGLYLVHWPIFIALDARRTGLDGWSLFTLRVVASVAAAQILLVAVEQPFRTWQPVRRPGLGLAGVAVGATAVLVAAAAVPPTAPVGTGVDLAAAQERFRSPFVGRAPAAQVTTAPAAVEPGDRLTRPTGALEMAVAWRAGHPVRAVPPPRPPTIGVFGDSTALMTAIGLELHSAEVGLPPVTGAPLMGCGLIEAGWVNLMRSEPVGSDCAGRIALWTTEVDRNPIEVAVLQFGPWEVADYQLPGDPVDRSIGDPLFDEHLRAEMREAVGFFALRDIPVVWLLAPELDLSRFTGPLARPNLDAGDPVRMAGWNALVHELAAERSDQMTIIDLPALLDDNFTGGAMAAEVRPDGVHFNDWSAQRVGALLQPIIADLSAP